MVAHSSVPAGPAAQGDSLDAMILAVVVEIVGIDVVVENEWLVMSP